VEVNNGGNSQINLFRDKFLREKYDDYYNLYSAQLINGHEFPVCFDYGCTNCYVSESLAQRLPTYAFSQPNNL
jgi:hypothetical protein